MPKATSLAALLAALLLLSIPQPARAGTYTVLECHHAAPQNESHEAVADASPPGGPYAIRAGGGTCANASAEYSLGIRPVGDAFHGEYGMLRFNAPEGTKFTGVALDARLRSEAGHRARLMMANAAGVEKVRIAAGGAGPQSFAHYTWPASGHPSYQQFDAGLICDNAPYNCPMSSSGGDSETTIRNLRFELDDTVAPEVELSGSLLSLGG